MVDFAALRAKRKALEDALVERAKAGEAITRAEYDRAFINPPRKLSFMVGADFVWHTLERPPEGETRTMTRDADMDGMAQP